MKTLFLEYCTWINKTYKEHDKEDIHLVWYVKYTLLIFVSFGMILYSQLNYFKK